MGKVRTNKDLNDNLNKYLAYLYSNGYSTVELAKLSGVQSGATYNRIKKVVGTMRSSDESREILKQHPDDFEKEVRDFIVEKGLYDYFIELYNKKPKPKEQENLKVKNDLLEKRDKFLSNESNEEDEESYGATVAELYQLSESLIENYYNFTDLEKVFISEDVIIKIKDTVTGELKKYNDSNYKDFQSEIKRIVLSKSKKAIVEKNLTFSANLSEDEFSKAKKYMDNSLKVLEDKFNDLKISIYFRKRGKHIKLRLVIYNDLFK